MLEKGILRFHLRCHRRHETSIRRWSFLAQLHRYIQDIMIFIYQYISGSTWYLYGDFSGISYMKTAADRANFVRDLAMEFYVRKNKNDNQC